jgi:putative transcriptional regulator
MITKGSILISEPYLGDSNFERTVVLVCEHNEQGTFGYILNKPTAIEIASVIRDLDNFPLNLYIGGPVSQDSVHFIHRSRYHLEGAMEIQENVYWGGDFDAMKIMIQQGKILPEEIRFFIGYSGWGEGQLLREIDNKSWIISTASAEDIFETEPENFWRSILKNMGGRFKALSNYPIDPRLN